MADKKRYRLGLIGWPVEHSFSPALHQAALQHFKLDGDYNLYPIPPTAEGETNLKEILAAVARGEIQGLNVTIPHKQAVIPLLDTLTPTAKAVGAVNTITHQGGLLTGDNTDAPGFLADLDRFLAQKPTGGGHQTKTALILGAGGSARAVSYALLRAGWQVTLAARRVSQAQKLASDLSLLPKVVSKPLAIQVAGLNHTDLSPLSPHLIVNTTPLGMRTHSDRSPWPEEIPLPPHAVVYDLVYNPEETPLIRQARLAGLAAVSGIGMLIEQAALSFQIWTGYAVPFEVMHRAYNAIESGQPVS